MLSTTSFRTGYTLCRNAMGNLFSLKHYNAAIRDVRSTQDDPQPTSMASTTRPASTPTSVIKLAPISLTLRSGSTTPPTLGSWTSPVWAASGDLLFGADRLGCAVCSDQRHLDTSKERMVLGINKYDDSRQTTSLDLADFLAANHAANHHRVGREGSGSSYAEQHRRH